MNKRKSLNKILMILFVILTFSITSGYATWFISDSESISSSVESSGSDTYHKVGFKYITTQITSSSSSVNYNYPSDSNYKNATSNSIYNEVIDILKSIGHSNGIVGSITGAQPGRLDTEGSLTVKEGSFTKTIKTDPISDSNGVTSWTETIYSFSLNASGTYYYKTWFLGSVDSRQVFGTKGSITTVSYKQQSVEDDTSRFVHNVKNGSKIKVPSLSLDGNILAGFYKADETTGLATDTPFDFSAPITKNTTVFVKWVSEIDQEGNQTKQLSNYINGLTSGTGNVRANGDYNILEDATYNSSTGQLNLNTATLKSGVTVNFALNSGVTNQEATEGTKITNMGASTASSDKYISVDYMNTSGVANTKDYEIVLQGDLTVKGNLVIGGITGSTNATVTGPQGHIMGNYVKLDLNGHDLIIESGGTVHSFGLITDSVGTGKVEVQPGGILKTQFVIYAVKGGNHTLWSYSKGICPFEHYTFPYIDCRVELINGETESGCLDIFSRLNLGSLGFTNTYIPFLGKSSDTNKSYFVETTKKGTADSKTVIVPQKLETLQNANSNNLITKNMLHIKNLFEFNNVNATIKNISIGAYVYVEIPILDDVDQEFQLDLSRVSFPISPNMDFVFKNSNFTISQNIIFMPGSSMYMDQNSTLNLDYYKGETGGTTAVAKEFKSISVATKTLPGQTNYISGGIMAMTENLNDSQKLVDSSIYGLFAADYNNYWKYFKEAQITIHGKINFISGNEAPYKLAGNINVSNYSVNNGTNQKWNQSNINSLKTQVKIQTYDIEITAVNFFWFNSDNILSTNNNAATCSANRYYTLPLISNGVAYIADSNTNNLSGSWDNNTGVFSSADGTKYFFYTPNSLLTGDAESAIDYSITPTQCTVTENHSVMVGSQEYVYYAGYMVPVDSRTDSDTVLVTPTKLSTKTVSQIQLDYKTATFNSKSFYTWVRYVA